MLPAASFSYLRRASLLALALVASACSGGTSASQEPGTPGTNAQRHATAPYVVLLSLDGFRHDYLDRYPTPALGRVASEGVRADRMIPVFPTKTFASHYTIATGLHAEHHGLVGNRFWDPERGELYALGNRDAVEDGTWYRGEPIWVTAERQGMVTAAFYFVGTEADVGGIRPTNWKRYDAAVGNAARVDSVLAWLALPPETRPHLITMYFSDLDDIGHAFGPDSPETRDAVAAVDVQIGRLLDGFSALPHGGDVYLFIVSDHGMLRAEATRAQPVDTALFRGVRMVEGGPYASLWVDEGGAERLPGLRDSLRTLLPEADVWLRTEVPPRFHYSADPRIGDIVILAYPGATVVTPDRMPGKDGFTHGWDNLTPAMGAIFLGRGPHIAPGQRIAEFESVHVYPLLAHLLGLEPAPVDGRLEVLAPILGGAGPGGNQRR
ncbi:MAG TPA: ectonucleotide pyrophosphatase/phosphodiesterase [Longimicrobiales bacterium]|nr:ectonucleotide pyrophosphatase/phosphodiesterase [Longimicrobiales bacterium]